LEEFFEGLFRALSTPLPPLSGALKRAGDGGDDGDGAPQRRVGLLAPLRLLLIALVAFGRPEEGRKKQRRTISIFFFCHLLSFQENRK